MSCFTARHNRVRVVRAVLVDMFDGLLHTVDDSNGEDHIEVLRPPILFRRGGDSIVDPTSFFASFERSRRNDESGPATRAV